MILSDRIRFTPQIIHVIYYKQVSRGFCSVVTGDNVTTNGLNGWILFYWLVRLLMPSVTLSLRVQTLPDVDNPPPPSD